MKEHLCEDFLCEKEDPLRTTQCDICKKWYCAGCWVNHLLCHDRAQIIPPALFTNEMLEQIRAVVREEIAAVKKQTAWAPENEDTFLRGVLRSRLSLGAMGLSEYRAELARLDKQKIQARDTSTVASLPVVKYREYDPEIEGHPSLTTELEHQGKLYKGILYYQKDIE